MANPRPNEDSPTGSPPDLPPSFIKFPLLRTILFLAGIDAAEVVSDIRERGVYSYMRGIFNLLSVNQYPDTSSTRRIITSSVVEIVSALSIVSLVAVFARVYYTLPGTSSDTSLVPNHAIVMPILAAFFTLFALITAALTAFSMRETVRTSRLSMFIPLVFPEVEMCTICLEADSVANLVNLQCYSDEDANSGKRLHYFHEGCLESWWSTAPDGRCPICRQTALAYRTVDGEYRYPSPEPSPLTWAMYSFFACVQFFFGSRRPFMATRNLPHTQNSLGEHFVEVLVRGVGALAVILFARLILAISVYASYFVIPLWANEYPATRLLEQLKTMFIFFDMRAIKGFIHAVRSGPHVTRYKGWPSGGDLTETLIFNLVSVVIHQIRKLTGVYKYLIPRHIQYSEYIEYSQYFLKWLQTYLSDIGSAGAWFPHVAIVTLPLIFIHGFVLRTANLIIDITRINGDEMPPVPVDRFFIRMNILCFGLFRFLSSGVDLNPTHDYILAPVFNGFLIAVIVKSRVAGPPLIAYVRNALELMGYSPDWAFILLVAVAPLYLLTFCFYSYVLYLTVWLTIWEDLLQQLFVLTLTHAAAKACVSFWPEKIAFQELQGYGAIILTICILFPLMRQTVSRVWFFFP